MKRTCGLLIAVVMIAIVTILGANKAFAIDHIHLVNSEGESSKFVTVPERLDSKSL